MDDLSIILEYVAKPNVEHPCNVGCDKVPLPVPIPREGRSSFLCQMPDVVEQLASCL